MTVITKPLSENKAKKLKEPFFSDEVKDKVPKVDVESGVEPRFVLTGARAQKVTTATTVCLFLTALLVMSIGIIGGMYIYKQFTRSHTRFHGWCTIPYNVHANLPHEPYVSEVSINNFRDAKASRLDQDAETFDSFKQEFEIDLEDEEFEKILVPNFGRGKRGKFIHDFRTNKTGIIDLKENRCFVMPLNRQRVLPPHDMRDLVEKMFRGYYEVDMEVVRETMMVVMPPITDFKTIGSYIAQECRNRKTYLLEKYDDDRRKRSAPTSEAIFSEFAGRKISELFIDTSGVEEYENREAALV